MAHSFHHAESSARKFGGRPDDYLAVHTWFDVTKEHLALPGHRALGHHASGIFEAERVFGVTLTNSAGREVPVRFIGEQHVREDCRCIPTVADWLKHLPIEPWMVNGVILPDIEHDMTDADIMAWRAAVAARQTTLGYTDWAAQHHMRSAGRHAFEPVDGISVENILNCPVYVPCDLSASVDCAIGPDRRAP